MSESYDELANDAPSAPAEFRESVTDVDCNFEPSDDVVSAPYILNSDVEFGVDDDSKEESNYLQYNPFKSRVSPHVNVVFQNGSLKELDITLQNLYKAKKALSVTNREIIKLESGQTEQYVKLWEFRRTQVEAYGECKDHKRIKATESVENVSFGDSTLHGYLSCLSKIEKKYVNEMITRKLEIEKHQIKVSQLLNSIKSSGDYSDLENACSVLFSYFGRLSFIQVEDDNLFGHELLAYIRDLMDDFKASNKHVDQSTTFCLFVLNQILLSQTGVPELIVNSLPEFSHDLEAVLLYLQTTLTLRESEMEGTPVFTAKPRFLEEDFLTLVNAANIDNVLFSLLQDSNANNNLNNAPVFLSSIIIIFTNGWLEFSDVAGYSSLSNFLISSLIYFLISFHQFIGENRKNSLEKIVSDEKIHLIELEFETLMTSTVSSLFSSKYSSETWPYMRNLPFKVLPVHSIKSLFDQIRSCDIDTHVSASVSFYNKSYLGDYLNLLVNMIKNMFHDDTSRNTTKHSSVIKDEYDLCFQVITRILDFIPDKKSVQLTSPGQCNIDDQYVHINSLSMESEEMCNIVMDVLLFNEKGWKLKFVDNLQLHATFHLSEAHLKTLCRLLKSSNGDESRYSRCLLSKVDWSLLPIEMRRKCALAIVEFIVRRKCFLPENLQKRLEVVSETPFWMDRVQKYVTSTLDGSAAEDEKEIENWCLKMFTLQLHLHANDIFNLKSAENISDTLFDYDYHADSELAFVQTGSVSDTIYDYGVSCFATLCLTHVGHSIPEINRRGFSLIHKLTSVSLNVYKCGYDIKALNLLTPYFFASPDPHMKEDELNSIVKQNVKALMYKKSPENDACQDTQPSQVNVSSTGSTTHNLGDVLSAILTKGGGITSWLISDYASNPVTGIFMNMLFEQCENFALYGLKSDRPILTFWLTALTSIPQWFESVNIVSLVDGIFKFVIHEKLNDVDLDSPTEERNTYILILHNICHDIKIQFVEKQMNTVQVNEEMDKTSVLNRLTHPWKLDVVLPKDTSFLSFAMTDYEMCDGLYAKIWPNLASNQNLKYVEKWNRDELRRVVMDEIHKSLGGNDSENIVTDFDLIINNLPIIKWASFMVNSVSVDSVVFPWACQRFFQFYFYNISTSSNRYSEDNQIDSKINYTQYVGKQLLTCFDDMTSSSSILSTTSKYFTSFWSDLMSKLKTKLNEYVTHCYTNDPDYLHLAETYCIWFEDESILDSTFNVNFATMKYNPELLAKYLTPSDQIDYFCFLKNFTSVMKPYCEKYTKSKDVRYVSKSQVEKVEEKEDEKFDIKDLKSLNRVFKKIPERRVSKVPKDEARKSALMNARAAEVEELSLKLPDILESCRSLELNFASSIFDDLEHFASELKMTEMKMESVRVSLRSLLPKLHENVDHEVVKVVRCEAHNNNKGCKGGGPAVFKYQKCVVNGVVQHQIDELHKEMRELKSFMKSETCVKMLQKVAVALLKLHYVCSFLSIQIDRYISDMNCSEFTHYHSLSKSLFLYTTSRLSRYVEVKSSVENLTSFSVLQCESFVRWEMNLMGCINLLIGSTSQICPDMCKLVFDVLLKPEDVLFGGDKFKIDLELFDEKIGHHLACEHYHPLSTIGGACGEDAIEFIVIYQALVEQGMKSVMDRMERHQKRKRLNLIFVALTKMSTAEWMKRCNPPSDLLMRFMAISLHYHTKGNLVFEQLSKTNSNLMIDSDSSRILTDDISIITDLLKQHLLDIAVHSCHEVTSFVEMLLACSTSSTGSHPISDFAIWSNFTHALLRQDGDSSTTTLIDGHRSKCLKLKMLFFNVEWSKCNSNVSLKELNSLCEEFIIVSGIDDDVRCVGHRLFAEDSQIVKMMHLFVMKFDEERHSMSCGVHGLYTKYGNFIFPHLTNFLLVLSHFAIFNRHHQMMSSNPQSTTQTVSKLFSEISDLFSSWIQPMVTATNSNPLTANNKSSKVVVSLPWSPNDSDLAHHTFYAFVLCLRTVSVKFHGLESCLCSLVWHFYSNHFGHEKVKDYILYVVHENLLNISDSFWSNFTPKKSELESMTRIIDTFLPLSHIFVGQIVMEISWSELFNLRIREMMVLHDDERNRVGVDLTDFKCVVSSFFKLIVKLSTEPLMRQNVEFKNMVLDVDENFTCWSLVNDFTYESVIQWFVMSCDCRSLVQHSKRHPIDGAIFRILASAGGMVHEETANEIESLFRKPLTPSDARLQLTKTESAVSPQTPNDQSRLKSFVYVKAIVKLFWTCSSKQSIFIAQNVELFKTAFMNLIQLVDDKFWSSDKDSIMNLHMNNLHEVQYYGQKQFAQILSLYNTPLSSKLPSIIHSVFLVQTLNWKPLLSHLSAFSIMRSLSSTITSQRSSFKAHLMEHLIEKFYFETSTSSNEDAACHEVVSEDIWPVIVEDFLTGESNSDPQSNDLKSSLIVKECVKSGHVLTLHLFTLIHRRGGFCSTTSSGNNVITDNGGDNNEGGDIKLLTPSVGHRENEMITVILDWLKQLNYSVEMESKLVFLYKTLMDCISDVIENEAIHHLVTTSHYLKIGEEGEHDCRNCNMNSNSKTDTSIVATDTKSDSSVAYLNIFADEILAPMCNVLRQTPPQSDTTSGSYTSSLQSYTSVATSAISSIPSVFSWFGAGGVYKFSEPKGRLLALAVLYFIKRHLDGEAGSGKVITRNSKEKTQSFRAAFETDVILKVITSLKQQTLYASFSELLDFIEHYFDNIETNVGFEHFNKYFTFIIKNHLYSESFIKL